LQYILPKLSAVAVEANDAQSLPIMKVISAIHEANEDAKKIIDAQSAESVQKEHEQNED
jgi:hypothetical protein